MEINNKEIFRYAGFKGNEPSSEIIAVAENIKQEVISSVSPKHIVKEVCFTRTADGIMVDDTINFISKKLLSHLKSSERLLLFAATLGVEGDRITKKYSSQSSVKAVLAQATLAAAIESYCDTVCEDIALKEKTNGFYLRPRFSPGYADMALSQQKEFFKSLEITKRIGVTLNDEYMMIPTKSVTAFIGITKDRECNFNNCLNCTNTDCEFRR